MNESLMRRCPHCGVSNRIPPAHLADTGRCGSCKAPLPPADEPIAVDTAAFDCIVGGSRVPVFADFWAGWCGPCRMAAPEVDALAREMAGRAIVLKVDTEKHPELASRYRVQSIPNFMVFQGGHVVRQQAGLVSRAQMRQWLEQAATA